MENKTVISVNNLCKTFDIYDSPADRVKELFSLTRKKYSTSYTVLRDINFSIKEGEFVGILGRNGAGKSTLLKMLSGQLTPTEGTVHVNGTVSLLQLGVGFNKELNGLDNIRFASRVLGNDEEKIEEIIKEVVEFADIGSFIHHPVKTYSSGMYSRLAFAIGISINPDILIVDEVLSVGDMMFASKCLSKLHELKKGGKTVIIVTHDVEKVSVFCDRAIWLKDSRISSIGLAKDIVELYRDDMLLEKKGIVETKVIPKEHALIKGGNKTPENEEIDKEIEWMDISGHKATQKSGVKITHMALYDKKTKKNSSAFKRGDDIQLYLKISSNYCVNEIVVGWNLIDKKGLIAVHSGSNFCANNIKKILNDDDIVCCFDFIMPPLKNSEYIFSLGIREEHDVIYKVNNVYPIQVINEDYNSQQGGYVILENSSFCYQNSRDGGK